jgi:hypothetical protein
MSDDPQGQSPSLGQILASIKTVLGTPPELPPQSPTPPATTSLTAKAPDKEDVKPKSALAMTKEEYAAAKRGAIRDANRQRQADDQAAMMERLSRKYPK